MQQQEFIWFINNTLEPGTIHQDDIGNTTVNMRPTIELQHNYKKKNLMTVTFTESNMVYRIPSRKELELIVKLHLENVNIGEALRKYCDSYLEKN